jgi:NAD(P)H-dependent FMN reductase|tara:strand:- start:510 stop:734 length:225 start_codon:yes stop_codon:yes gene_type:complete
MGQNGAIGGIRIVIIPGSVRPGNFTSMAVALVADEVRKRSDVALDVIDTAELNFGKVSQRSGVACDARRLKSHA